MNSPLAFALLLLALAYLSVGVFYIIALAYRVSVEALKHIICHGEIFHVLDGDVRY